MANINIEVILEIFFLTFNNTNIQFDKKKLIYKFYILAKAQPTTKQMEFVNKKQFAKIV